MIILELKKILNIHIVMEGLELWHLQFVYIKLLSIYTEVAHKTIGWRKIEDYEWMKKLFHCVLKHLILGCVTGNWLIHIWIIVDSDSAFRFFRLLVDELRTGIYYILVFEFIQDRFDSIRISNSSTWKYQMTQFDNEQMQTFPRIFEIRKHNSWST